MIRTEDVGGSINRVRSLNALAESVVFQNGASTVSSLRPSSLSALSAKDAKMGKSLALAFKALAPPKPKMGDTGQRRRPAATPAGVKRPRATKDFLAQTDLQLITPSRVLRFRRPGLRRWLLATRPKGPARSIRGDRSALDGQAHMGKAGS